MQLVATDIHGIDLPGAACQQELGKSAGRGADIEADAAARIKCGVESELIEGGRELYATARDVRMRRLGAQGRVGRYFLRRPLDDELIGAHTTRGNGCLRLSSALEYAALHEQTIDANAAGHALCSAHEMMSGLPLSATSEMRGGTNNDTCLLFQTVRYEASRRAGVKPARIDRESNYGT